MIRKLAAACLMGMVMVGHTFANENNIAAPETTTPVALSNTSVNRIVCTNGNINDVFYSKEKGMVINVKGSNAFVKYLIRQKGDTKQLVTEETEIHVVCAGDVYTLIASPNRGPAMTVRLSSGLKNRIRQNLDTVGILDREEQVLMLTQKTYKDEIPDGFTVTETNKVIKVKPDSKELTRLFGSVEIVQRREIKVDGVGMMVREYTIDARDYVEMLEVDFLQKEFGTEIAGVTVQPLKLSKGEQGRLIIVEKVMN